MPVKIRGNEYETVPERLHEAHGDSGAKANVSIVTEIVGETEEHITMKAEVTIVKEDGRVVVNVGHAREYFDFTTKKAINFAFALENCETSAVGRALANAGYLGQKVASEEDMENVEDKKRARESQLADGKPVRKPSTKPSNNGQQVSPEVQAEWDKIVREAKSTWAGMAVGAKDKDGNDVTDRPAWKQEVQDKFVALYSESNGFNFYANTWKDLSRAELDVAYKSLFPSLVDEE